MPFAPEVPAALRQLLARGCSGLSLIDANPINAASRPLNVPTEARVAFDVRGARFE